MGAEGWFGWWGCFCFLAKESLLGARVEPVFSVLHGRHWVLHPLGLTSGLFLPASPSWVLGRGVRRSPAWSSLNHSWHAGLIQLGTERCFPLLATLTRGAWLL